MGCSKGLLRIALAALALHLAGAWPSPATEPSARIEVPVVRHRLSNGDIRFAVSVRVGSGAPMDAMLDTGSFGLRVLAHALSPKQYQPIGIVRGYGYRSGVVLRGPLATAQVTIGEATTGTPISIQVVQSVFCNVRQPTCPASRVSPADYRIGGDGLPREGFDAILGISLRGSDAPGAALNPLSTMGRRRWIVILPRPGATAPGWLIINPDADEMAGFHTVRLRPPVDTEIPDCPEQPLDQQASCPLMMLDSGAAAGVHPFYAYAVLYDSADGTIAVKPR